MSDVDVAERCATDCCLLLPRHKILELSILVACSDHFAVLSVWRHVFLRSLVSSYLIVRVVFPNFKVLQLMLRIRIRSVFGAALLLDIIVVKRPLLTLIVISLLLIPITSWVFSE